MLCGEQGMPPVNIGAAQIAKIRLDEQAVNPVASPTADVSKG